MKRSLSVRWKGIEPIFIYKYAKEHEYGTIETALFYPLRRLKGHWENAMLWLKLYCAGYRPVRCEGCGEGYVEYVIKSPNQVSLKDKSFWLCCRHCVFFYDFFWSKMPFIQRRRSNGRLPKL